jgi:pyrroloquinoline-quinone synthase
MEFWQRVQRAGEQYSVLRHPFYVRWSQGALSLEELAHYSGQYRHAVVALADATASAARSPEAGADAPALAAHAAEEAGHIELWDEFVAAVDGDAASPATPETRACASTWAGDGSRPLLHTLMAMYAVESAQPAISATKRSGLAEHYGIDSASYFEVHEQRDLEHAAEVRSIIQRRRRDADEDALVSTVEAVLQANLLLLDGVEAATRN